MARLLRSLLMVLVLPLAAAEDSAGVPELPARERFHLFLLAGQSNMAGRGEVAPADREAHPRVLMLDAAGNWVPAVDPMHFDKPIAAVGPGRSFGWELARVRPDVTIGLIPCAVGGSPIDSWQPGIQYPETGAFPWDDAIRRTHRARPDGVLRGILWHQGESDSSPELAPDYAAKLHALVARFRAEFGEPELPFIVGQLGRFEGRPWDDWTRLVDQAHRELPGRVPRTAFVPSDGLCDKGDALHFDAASAREFGWRYAKAYLALTGWSDR